MATSTKAKPRVSAAVLQLDPDTYAAVRAKAERQGATLAGILRALVTEWLDQPTRPLIAPAEDKPST
jgi:hypothetical protein